MPSSKRAAASPLPADVKVYGAPQLDLFPARPQVERLDPRTVVGRGTGVRAVVRVRLQASASPHLIFHDRHGWYCELHGAECIAVAVARRNSE